MCRPSLLVAFATLTLLFAGCSHMVTVAHKPKATHSVLDKEIEQTRRILPTKVLIQPPVAGGKPKHQHMGLVIAGPQNIWKVNLNETLPNAMKSAMEKTYFDVQIGHSCGDCGLIFRPKVKHVDFANLSMRATVEIEVQVYDAHRSKIATLTAIGKSPLMDLSRFSTGVAGYFIPFFGTAVGKNLVAKTSRRALNEAMADFHLQILQETEPDGALARYWLPKRENRGYELGKHQFHAERVAIKAGCSIQRDEIKLVSQHFHSEKFIAHCWGKPSFAIDCEYGRCALGKEPPSLAQREEIN